MSQRKELQRRLYGCLGKVIMLRRKRLGISQEELAKDTGVDRAFISSIENGKRSPSFGSVQRIARGLNMRFTRLVDNTERCFENPTDSDGRARSA